MISFYLRMRRLGKKKTLTVKRIDLQPVRGSRSVRSPTDAEGVVANVVGVKVRDVQVH